MKKIQNLSFPFPVRIGFKQLSQLWCSLKLFSGDIFHPFFLLMKAPLKNCFFFSKSHTFQLNFTWNPHRIPMMEACYEKEISAEVKMNCEPYKLILLNLRLCLCVGKAAFS
jgi:hypothetical protein